VRDDPYHESVPKIDTSRPGPARFWNYLLGGKDNYAVDREYGDRYIAAFPGIVQVARESRAFLGRAVRLLAGEKGVRQFLDIGTGLPTADNTHEVAQRVAPDARIVYVDNDPMVLAHARALLTSGPEGMTEYLDADVHYPESIVDQASKTLDFTQPVALMLLGILGHVADHDEAVSIVRRLVDPLPSGSYLVVNDGTNVITPRQRNEAARILIEEGGSTAYYPRNPDQIKKYFDGLELLDPGVVSTPRWRYEGDTEPAEIDVFCGVAIKP
jgi:hypothetical protein